MEVDRPSSPNPFLKNVGATLGLLVVLATCVAALFAWNSHQLSRARAMVDHTHEVLDELEALRTSIARVESAIRGFVVTGDPGFLPSDREHHETGEHLARIRALVADNPTQERRVDELERAVTDRLRQADEVARARQEQGFTAAQAIVAGRAGLALSAEVERRVREMAKTETDLLELSTRWYAQIERVIWVVGLGLLGFVLAVAVAAYRTNKSQRAARELAEAESVATEHRFRILVESVSDYALFLLDASGRVKSWNPGAARLKGYSAEEIIGRSLSTFFTDEDRARGAPEAELRIAEREGKSEGEGWRVRKDGSRFWANFVLTAIRDDQGRLQGFAKVTRDVTERRRWALIAEASSLLLSSRDVEVALEEVTKLCVPFLSDWAALHLVEAEGLRLASVVHPDPAKKALALELNRRFPEGPEGSRIWRAIRTGEPEVIAEISPAMLEQAARSPDHRELVKELGLRSALIAPIHGRDRVLGALVLVTAESARRYGDSELALAQELARRCGLAIENARAQAAVEVEREFLEATLRQLREGVVVGESPVGRVILANEAAMRILRVAGEKPEAVNTKRFFDTQGRLVPEAEFPLRRALRHGEHVPETELVIGHNGDRTFISVGAAPVKDRSGRTVGAVASFRDITQKKLEEQRALEESRFREMFIGILAHDLRTPLSAISVGSELLLRKSRDPVEAKTLGRIVSSADRMSAMISDLLDLTRIRLGGGIQARLQRVDLAVVSRQVVDEIALAHPATSIAFEARGDSNTEADPERFAQVVSNLVGNAVSYGSSGGQVRVDIEGTADAVELRVHNRGQPIPIELLPVIFDPFRRAAMLPGTEEPKGLGLGLFIAKEIVKSHHGSIEVTSTLEDGTTFRVRLPRPGLRGPEPLH